MKILISLIISAALVVSGYAQTRNVLVGTNNTVVQPTNFWSADASNARTGLGLGSAATNPASAFQPSSTVLSNLASSNAVNLTNLRATNIVGTIAISNGGTGATNNSLARTNLGLGWSALTNTNTATSLLGFTTNGQVVANTGTNVLAFTTNVSFQGGPLINGSGIFYISDTNGGLNLEEGRITDINNTDVLNWSDSVQLAIERPLTFGTNAATTRTNLGLGATNSVRFGSIILQDEGGTSNNITYGGEGLEFYTGGQLFLATEGGYGVTFYRPIYFSAPSNAATTRTNLGLGWSALTNSNAANFRTNIGLGLAALTNTNTSNFRSDIGLGWSALTNTNAGTAFVSVNSTGVVVSPTNFWTASPLGRVGYIQYSAPIASSTNLAEAARNLFVFSLAPTINGVTNTVQLPVTTNSALYGDIAVVVHRGPTNSATIVRNGIDLITLTQESEAISLLYGTNGWDFYPNLAFHEPIYFTTTNAALYAARSRTNLGLPLTALTNSNTTNFQAAIFATNSTPTNGANVNAINFNTAIHWMEVNVVTNGVTNNFRIPLFK